MNKGIDNRSTPILVTGMHRSGTTWVGKMLAANQDVAYISEPLNVNHRPGVFQAPTQYWYMYINQNNQQDFLPAFQDTIAFRYHFFNEFQAIGSWKGFFRMMRDGISFLNARILGKRALIKDPFAIFSTPWFTKRLDCQVVIIVRHPAAVINSMNRLGWRFDFSDLLAQEELMRDWLSPFQREIESMLDKSSDIISQGSLLWKMIYHVVAQFQEMNLGLQIYRHEDLSKNPLDSFQDIYRKIDLRFTKIVGKTILDYSNSDNPNQLSQGHTHSVRLNSQANLKSWKKHLDRGEIQRIRAITEETARRYYSNEDWD